MTTPPCATDPLDDVEEALFEMKRISGEFEAERGTGRVSLRPLDPHPLLNLGMVGPHVEVLQLRLNAHGASPSLAANGEFDMATMKALQWAQACLMLPSTGEADEQTWELLLASPVRPG